MRSYLLALFTVSLPILLPLVNGLPSLISRKKRPKIDVTSDWSDPTRPGWLHCYTSGTWLPTQLLTASTLQVCNPSQTTERITPVNSATLNYAVGAIFSASSFAFGSVGLAADGTPAVQHINVAISCPPQGLGEGGCYQTLASLYPQYYATLMSSQYANSEQCNWAMNKVMEQCPKGDYNDTQGGWWEYASDRTTYGMDPSRVEHYTGGAP